MTRDEVIKAFEICTVEYRKCDGCPLFKKFWCKDILNEKIMALLKAEPKAHEGGINMTMCWEDQYQVYRRYGDKEYDLRASDMTIDDAVLFVKAVFGENFNEPDLRFEIRRQPKEEEYL